ncbi:MAG TPA: CBS domain-containing protein [Deltaproteobacteria bacterium]|nr:CBS domain-containing protein [Deltaproteobacteria bacterium]
MHVGDICHRDVAVIGRRESLLEAARRMRESHVGSLVVIDPKEGEPVPVGILTDRDILVQVLTAGVSPQSVAAEDIMASHLVTAREEDGVFETIQQMQRKGIRRIPVVNSKQSLTGILTLDDLLEYFAKELKNLSGISSLERERETTSHP